MTTDADLLRAIDAAGANQTPDTLATLTEALGQADGFILSMNGTPLQPNPRAMRSRDGKLWLSAFSSAQRAIASKPAEDRILRAPMPVICATGQAPGFAGVALNIGSAPWMLIQGSMLRAVASLKGSGNPITMVNAEHAEMVVVQVRSTGAIEADGKPVTLEELRESLIALKERDGIVQYSRDDPDGEPTGPVADAIKAVLDAITSLRLPVQLARQATAAEVAEARDSLVDNVTFSGAD
jgi:hypothetical protein